MFCSFSKIYIILKINFIFFHINFRQNIDFKFIFCSHKTLIFPKLNFNFEIFVYTTRFFILRQIIYEIGELKDYRLFFKSFKFQICD